MSKIIPFKDMRVEKPDTYKITRSDGIEEIVKIEFAPGMIYEQGTKDNAENFNSIQNNCVYRVDGVRKIEGNEEIYDIVITDYSNYTPSDLTILINIDSSNTTEAPKIRLNKEKYSIINEFGNVPIDFLTSKNTFTIILDYIKKTAKITSGDYKLKPATASVIGGVKIGSSMTVSADGTIDSILNQTVADGRYVNKTTQIVAGNGLTGGGDLTTSRTINIVSNNGGIVVGTDSIELKPATTSVIGGVKVGGSMTVSADGTIDAILNQTVADGRYVNVTGDTMTGQLNGTSASFSGNVTASNALYTNTLVLNGWTIAIV